MSKYQIKVVIFSHGGDIPTDLIIKAAENVDFTAARVNNVKQIRGKIGIVHPEDGKSWEQIISESDPGDVRVRMASGGFSAAPAPVCCGGVSIFYLVLSPCDVEQTEWCAILKGLSDDKIVSGLIRGEDRGNLKRFFFHRSMENILALAILCQGYLAAHGGDSLDGWDELPEALRNKVKTVKKQALVNRPSWWIQAFRESPYWKGDLTNEMKDLIEQKDLQPEITAAIDNLVMAFEAGGDFPAIDTEDPDIVHKAYDTCKSLLRGRL